MAGAREGSLGGEALLALAEALTWVGHPLPVKVRCLRTYAKWVFPGAPNTCTIERFFCSDQIETAASYCARVWCCSSVVLRKSIAKVSQRYRKGGPSLVVCLNFQRVTSVGVGGWRSAKLVRERRLHTVISRRMLPYEECRRAYIDETTLMFDPVLSPPSVPPDYCSSSQGVITFGRRWSKMVSPCSSALGCGPSPRQLCKHSR